MDAPVTDLRMESSFYSVISVISVTSVATNLIFSPAPVSLLQDQAWRISTIPWIMFAFDMYIT